VAVDVLRVIWQSVVGFWEDLMLLLVLSIVWSLAVLLAAAPLFVLDSTNLLLGVGLSLLLFLPVPIISGGLCFVTNQISRERVVGWGTFLSGLRRYWAKSLAVALIDVIFLGLVVFNFQFYASVVQGSWTVIVRIIFLVLVAYWLLAQIYWFPMILELESEKIFQALRNALAIVLISPLFTLGLGVVLALLAALCIVLAVPAVLFMAGLFLLVMNNATRNRLAMIQKKREKWAREEQEDEQND
jgi:uncharacterized membrane protein YesL